MKLLSLFTALFIGIISIADAQTETTSRKLPSIDLKDLNGNVVNTTQFENNGKPIILNFWATWCSPCKRELNTIAEYYDDWVEETGVKLIAVSIDDARSAPRVKPYADSKAWEYEIYLDENSNFKRAMNVQTPPFTFLLNGAGEIVYTHSGYLEGDEEELYEKLMELVEKE